MKNIIYVDGKYFTKSEAKVSVNDRGYHFGDAVYEVILYKDGNFFDFENHLTRLRSSLSSLNIKLTISDKSLLIICKYILKKNNISFGSLYIQVTRGVAERDHNYYGINMKPVLTIISKKLKINSYHNLKAINAITIKDTRWSYPNIKTIQLLPNVLAKSKAKMNNSEEAIFVDSQGFVTEGSSSNIWIVTKKNIIYTRSLDGKILPGITRKSVFKCAEINNFKIEEKKFTIKDLINSNEVFITSASSFVTPVVKIDNHTISDGLVGDFSKKLRETYLDLFK